MDHLTEQDAGLLEQAASMLEGLANDERNLGNCSSSEGAACSAHAIRRLAPALLRAGRGCLAQIEEPAHTWPAGLLDRVKSALERIENNHCIRRIPADPTDPDLVLAEVRYLLEGKTPPFWVSKLPQGTTPAAPAAPKREVTDGTRTLLEDCISAIRDYAGSRPEEGESWESWFEAAFDLCQSRVRRVFDDHALAAAPQAPAAPAKPFAYVVRWAGILPDEKPIILWPNQIAAHEDGMRAAGQTISPLYEGAAPAAPAVDAQGERDAAFEAVRQRLCRIPRWSFHIDSRGNLRRVDDARGNWIEFSAAHELFDPVAVDSALAAQAAAKGAA